MDLLNMAIGISSTSPTHFGGVVTVTTDAFVAFRHHAAIFLENDLCCAWHFSATKCVRALLVCNFISHLLVLHLSHRRCHQKRNKLFTRCRCYCWLPPSSYGFCRRLPESYKTDSVSGCVCCCLYCFRVRCSFFRGRNGENGDPFICFRYLCWQLLFAQSFTLWDVMRCGVKTST